MKKIVLVILALLMTVLMLAGCSGEPKVPEVFREVKAAAPTGFRLSADWTFEEAILNTPDIVKGTFVGYVGDESTGKYELEFSVDEVLKGDTDSDTIYVSVQCENWMDGVYKEYNYVEGHRYIICAQRYSSVYSDHDKYIPVASMFLPLDDDIGTYMNYESVELSNDTVSATKQITDYVEKLSASSAGSMNSISVPYTTSTDINEIAQECEYILRVTPTESVVVSDWRGTETFTCSVEEKIKGEYEIPDSIDIPFFIGQVEIGDSYIVMVNRAGGASGDSIVFTLAAKDNTVLPSDSAAVQRIMDALPTE